MGGQLQLWIDGEIEDVVGASYSSCLDHKGYLLRAAIQYLTTLSKKLISRQLLIDEGIIDVNSDDATASEVVLITNYRLRIESALTLLQSWLREPTGEEDGWNNHSTPKFERDKSGGIPEGFLEFVRHRKARLDSYENGPRPMPGSIMPAGISIDLF